MNGTMVTETIVTYYLPQWRNNYFVTQYAWNSVTKTYFVTSCVWKIGAKWSFGGKMKLIMVTKKHRHPLFAAVTKPIFRHSMYLKLGDENILRHLMCLKNRRQMKFWWEKEWDYGDTKTRHLIYTLVMKNIFGHSMCLKFGDQEISRHPLCLKNQYC